MLARTLSCRSPSSPLPRSRRMPPGYPNPTFRKAQLSDQPEAGGAGVSHPQPEGASFVRRPTSTVRRWAVRHTRRHRGVSRWDEPLIVPDCDVHGPLPLSFLNLLELRFLAGYRSHAPLRSIRRALDFAAAELGEPRPLLTLKFKVQGKSL